MIKKIKKWLRSRELPENNPEQFLKKGRKIDTKSVVACLGDSLTHGRYSGDYVALLQQRLSNEGYEFINGGIDGDLGYNVLKRLDTILDCFPDTVILLIGTNDINATFSPKVESGYRKNKGIPVTPTMDWSCNNVAEIFERFTAANVKNLAVLSIPMMGENLESDLTIRVVQYNERLRDLATKHQVNYLSLYECLIDELPKIENSPVYKGKMGPILVAAFRRIVLRQSFQSISKKNGLYFLTDHIHLNENGANIISNLVETYLRSVH